MKKSALIITLTLLLPIIAYAKNWGDISEPDHGKTRSIGNYTAGCISGAGKLPVDGYGYQVMRLKRNRYYGNPETIDYIKNLSREVNDELNGQLLIGDIGQPRGGPMNSGHASHQMGLDVDIWFWHPDDKRTLSMQEREETSAVSLINDQGKMTIDKKSWEHYSKTYIPDLLKLAVTNPEVDRIFVNPGIKRKLCSSYKGADWLHKIRPWWGHDYHFHVRLKCPQGSTECKTQEPIAEAGDGCGKELNYWFTEQAKADLAKMLKQPKKKPILPEACDRVLND